LFEAPGIPISLHRRIGLRWRPVEGYFIVEFTFGSFAEKCCFAPWVWLKLKIDIII
jgi:hypothetical protein|tara:strand:- start:148 stop:315 length:168 start_codon:yes stop_codon:yes gene_type:complete